MRLVSILCVCALLLLLVALYLPLFPRECGLQLVPGDPDVFICLTTIPPRLQNPWVWQNLSMMRSMLRVPEELESLAGITVVRCVVEGPRNFPSHLFLFF